MDKLQELTQKLYETGLSKGKEEGEALLAKAREEADKLVQEAREEAQAILARARKEADGYRTKVEGEVKMATTQALQSTRSTIENLLVQKAVDAPVKDVLGEEAFVKGIITAVAERFSAETPQDLSLVLPEKFREGLEPFVKNELAKLVGKGVEARFSKQVQGGFRIGPKDGGYFISFTDESFQELIGAYLRPATRKLLFG